ncbi:MAG: DUF2062 domain-containing protein [Deltaproteobacteria bacterium]|nr:DUF2062 domain-containing protein [Deltaproteobacteria bacterium]
MVKAVPSARPPSLFREELRRAWRELRGADLSPTRAALAVALGLFIGSQPIFGCHTPLVLTICILLQLDGLLAWVASNISNPFFAPFLVAGEIQLGGYLHTGEVMALSPELAWETAMSDYALYALSGAPIIGLALAIVGGLMVFGFVVVKRRWAPPKERKPYRLPANAPKWWRAVERVARRYAPLSERSTPAERTRFHYVRVKLLGDPVTQLIADLAGKGEDVLGAVLDIGTGRGQLPIVLLELGRAAEAQGFDWDDEKVAQARAAAESEPPLCATFAVADATTADFAPADTVLLIDVAHYLTLAEQDDLLERAAAAVRPGGRLIVREADTERGWRSWVTLAEELVFTTIRFNRGKRVRFRPAREIVAILEAAGLACDVQPAWGKTPFSNVLILGSRPQER